MGTGRASDDFRIRVVIWKSGVSKSSRSAVAACCIVYLNEILCEETIEFVGQRLYKGCCVCETQAAALRGRHRENTAGTGVTTGDLLLQLRTTYAACSDAVVVG